MSEAITVYFVVGQEPKSGQRHQLGKYFERAHADEHAARLSQWHDVRVETRSERLDAQHFAHTHLATLAPETSMSAPETSMSGIDAGPPPEATAPLPSERQIVPELPTEEPSEDVPLEPVAG